MSVVSAIARAVLIGLVSSTLAVAPAQAGTLGDDGGPITNRAGVQFGILAHRGGLLEWPENSVEALRNSVELGFDAIETDLVFTRDGRGVLNHYDRLTDRCTHADRSIHELTWAEVSKVRCANLAGRKVVPRATFEDLAALLATHPDVALVLDIKAYSGQTDRSKRSWAARAMSLVGEHGLLDRTSVTTFYWDTVLPTIRRYGPDTYVAALDIGGLDLDRVRRAAELGADGFGIRMRSTSEYLARYVRAKGMDLLPWEVEGTHARSFTIHYGGRRQLLTSNVPTRTRANLVKGRIDLDPVPKVVTTRLAVGVTVSAATYRAGRRHYPRVVGVAVPKAKVAMLKDVTLAITVRGGTGKGRLSVYGRGTTLSSSVLVDLPKGTRTITVRVPLGDDGRLRLFTTRDAHLTVKVVAFTNVRFA